MDNESPATKQDIEQLRGEMHGLETRLKGEMGAMETRLYDRMTEFMREIETRLLTAFHGYGRGQTARMHSLEIGQSDIGLRMAALEDRVLNLETGRGPGQQSH